MVRNTHGSEAVVESDLPEGRVPLDVPTVTSQGDRAGVVKHRQERNADERLEPGEQAPDERFDPLVRKMCAGLQKSHRGRPAVPSCKRPAPAGEEAGRGSLVPPGTAGLR